MKTTLALLSILVLLLASPGLAFADDAAQEDSPAARAYRDAWWTETATDDLERALALYGKAATLEGSPAIQARAYLRMGIVLERMGRTDEGIRALETLAREYPDQSELLEKSRALLEAWTAADLEGSFDEWYERYQYSPEFQAKVVDLVLRLGTTSFDRSKGPPAEERELLTIGDAALPALRRHLDTSNETLRGWVVALLLQLGEVPSPGALLDTTTWTYRTGAWETLLSNDEEDVGDLWAAIDGEGPLPRVLRAVTDGPDAALDLFREGGDVYRLPSRSQWRNLLEAILRRPGGEPERETLEAFVVEAEDPELDVATQDVFRSLAEAGEASPALWRHVIREGLPFTRGHALSFLAQGRHVDPEIWRDVAEALARERSPQPSLQLAGALFATLAPADDVDAELLVRAFERYSASSTMHSVQGVPLSGLAGEGIRRLVPFVVAGSRDERALRHALDLLSREVMSPKGDFDVEAFEQLLDFAASAPLPATRAHAGRLAGRLGGRGAPSDMALARLPRLEPEVAHELLAALPVPARHDDDALDLLLEAGVRLAEAGKVDRIPYQLKGHFQTPSAFLALFARVADRPAGVWAKILQYGYYGDAVKQDPGVAREVRSTFVAKWPSWSPEDRLAMVDASGRLLRGFPTDAAFETWLREALRAPDADPLLRRTLLWTLEEPALDDVRLAYDLSQPEQAAEVARYGSLPPTLEVYRALDAVRGHEDGAERDRFFGRWIDAKRVEPDVRHAVLRDMLDDPQAHTRAQAASLLQEFRDARDVPRFVAALGDEDAKVRRFAAGALASVYTTEALKALAAALDDPDPAVREQVLATLEAIKKAEELKAYWREFADGR